MKETPSKKPIAKKPATAINKKTAVKKPTAKKPAVKAPTKVATKAPVKTAPKKEVIKPVETKPTTVTKTEVEPAKKTPEKTPEAGSSTFQKQEEKIAKANINNTQNTGAQTDSVLSDFFNTATENASTTTPEETYKNPPLEKTKTNSSGEPIETTTNAEGETINSAHSGHADFNDWGFTEPEKKEGDGLDIDGTASSFFDDEEAVAEFVIELIDMGAGIGVSMLAKDFGNADENKWSLSNNRKNKLRKPLQLILKQRNIQMKPEWAFIGMLLAAYAPMLITAFAERNAKNKAEEVEIIRKRNLEAINKKEEKDQGPKAEGRTPKCGRCKKDVPDCRCEEGPKLSAYMKNKLGN